MTGDRAGRARPHWLVLLRCIRRAPGMARQMNARCRTLHAAFQAEIEPVLTAGVPDPAHRRALAAALLPWGVKIAALVDSYAEMTGRRCTPRLAILAGVFTRIYDDLLDEMADGTTADWLTALVSGAAPAPGQGLQPLAAALFTELTRLADRPRHEIAYRALAELHELQLRSLQQAGGTLPPAEVWDLTLRKGGAGMLVLGGLVHPDASPGEQHELRRIGRLLQLLDDYEDESTDRSRGLLTPATLSGLSPRLLMQQLAGLEPGLCSCYGRGPALRFLDGLYCWAYSVRVSRAVGRGRPPLPHSGAFPRRLPLRMLLARQEVIR